MVLHYICDMMEGRSPIDYCRRSDGDTILHCAIAAENFDLAFQIIHLYGDLVNWVNESGATPLHLLASKPSAFKSGSRLGRFERFIYRGILVKEPKAGRHCTHQLPYNTIGKCPENCRTCVDLLKMMNAALAVTIKLPLIEKFGRKNQTQMDDLEAVDNIGVETNSSGSEAEAWSHPLFDFFPLNYKCCADFIKFVLLVMLVIFGSGTTILTKMRRMKEKHMWSVKIMNELLQRSSMYEKIQWMTHLRRDELETSPYDVYDGGIDSLDIITEEQPSIAKGKAHQQNKEDEKDNESKMRRKIDETPLLIAAKHGVTEMVEKILELFPVAVHDLDAEGKNTLLLALENRQLHLYELLLKKKIHRKESLLRKVDYEANSALHLAAKLRVAGDYNESWVNPVAALQMHWEIKWFLFVEESTPPYFFRKYNKYGKTPREIFTETHKDLVRSSGEWLVRTSQSCSVVAALIATVAFATSTTVPGGVHDETGIPTFEAKPAYKVFVISSLIALGCSVNSVVLFLSILASRYQEYDFGKSIPRKLILGLTSMFMSISSMLVSFCAGHFLGLNDKLKCAALPVYAVICLPVTFFGLSHFPLYVSLICSTFNKVPRRSYEDAPL